MRILLLSVLVLLSCTSIICETTHTSSSSRDGWVTRGSAALSSLSVGQHTEVFGLTTHGRSVRFHRGRAGWRSFGSSRHRWTQIAVSCSGDVFALMRGSGKLYRKRGKRGVWAHLAAPVQFSRFSVGRGLDVWAVDKAGKPWRYVAAKKTWVATQAKLVSVEVGCKGEVMGITGDNNLWKFEEATGKWREIAKGIRAVSIGANVLVLDTDRNVYKYVPAAGSGAKRNVRAMVNLKKRALSIASGPTGEQWIVNLSGRAMEYTGLISEAKLNVAERAALEAKQGGTWGAIKTPGVFRSFDSGSDGEIFAVTRRGTVVFRAKGDNSRWTTLRAPRGMWRISVGCDGSTVFAIGKGNRVYKYVGSGRWNVFSERLRKISVGADGRQVWGINMNNRLVRWRPSSRTFAVQKGVNVRSIGAGCDGSLWLVTRGGRLFERSVRNPRLRYRGRDVRDVAVAGSVAYLLDRKRFLFRYSRPKGGNGEGKRNWVMLHKQLRRVAADANGGLFGISVSGALVKFARSAADPSDFGWKPLGASLDEICLGSASSIFGLDKGTVLHYTAAKTWAVIPGITLTEISCGCDGTAYGVRAPGLIYRYRSAQIGWERLPNSESIKRVAVGKSSNDVFGVNHAGQPAKWDSTTSTWTALKGKVSSIDATCSNDLWAVAENGDVLNLDEVTGHWAKVGTGAKRVAAGRGVYVIGKNDQLFKFDTERKHNRWVLLGPAARVAAGDDGAVVALTPDRRAVWVNQGSLVAPGPEIPPKLLHDPTADLPPPEPDSASLSSFTPGQEPELGAQDDLAKILAEKIKHGVAAANEGASKVDPADPEPYRPNGLDPDDPDARAADAKPANDVAQSFDAATDSAKPVDASNPN